MCAVIVWLAWRAAVEAERETEFWRHKYAETRSELNEAVLHLDFYIGELGRIRLAEVKRAAARLYVIPNNDDLN
jgi:hypothetical protein